MATNAERQKAYRERLKAASVSGADPQTRGVATEMLKAFDLARTIELPAETPNSAALAALLRVVDALYEAHASSSTWRIKMRSEIEKMRG